MLPTRVVFVNAHHVCKLVPTYQNCILSNKRPPLDKNINKLLSLQKNTVHPIVGTTVFKIKVSEWPETCFWSSALTHTQKKTKQKRDN